MTDNSENLFDLYYPFQKLNFCNWSVWSVKMEAALRCHGVWAVVATNDPDKLDADLYSRRGTATQGQHSSAGHPPDGLAPGVLYCGRYQDGA